MPNIEVNLPYFESTLAFPNRIIPLHAMMSRCGHQKVSATSYHWKGLSRGQTEFAIVQYTLKGKGRLEYEGNRLEVNPGDTMILHFPHHNRYWFEKGTPWEFVYLCIHGTEALRILRHIETEAGHLIPIPIQAEPIQQLLAACREARTGKLNTPLKTSARAYQFVMALAEELLIHRKHLQITSPIAKAIRYCQTHFKQSIGINEIAGHAGISRYYFSRKFKSVEGVSPGKFLSQIRIKEAIHLLQSTSLSVKEIGSKCGFQDFNYFCRAFRNQIGISPGSFRKSGMYQGL